MALSLIKLFFSHRFVFYSNNVTNLHQLTSHSMSHALQHGDRIVAIDNCDVTSALVYGYFQAVQSGLSNDNRQRVISDVYITSNYRWLCGLEECHVTSASN